MSLADTIAKLNAENTTSTDTAENPYSKLAHQTISLTKKTPNYLLRILPPAGDNSILAEYRRWFTKYEAKGNTRNTAFVMGAQTDPEDPLEQYIQDLDQAGRLTNSFGGKNWPSRRYLFNVVPYRVNQNDHTLSMVTDENGLPDVYVLDLGKNQAVSLMQELGDETGMKNPNYNQAALQQYGVTPTPDQIEYSFASSALAYPVYFQRLDTQPVTFKVEVMPQYPLAPLPQGWEQKLEDLDPLVQPSYQLNPSFVEYVINQGKAQIAQASQVAPQVAGNGSAPMWSPDAVASQMPSGMGAPAQQAPVNPVPNAPTFNTPQTPTAPVQTPTQAPTYVAPHAPTAPAQPTFPSAPVTSTPAPQAPAQQATEAPTSPLAGIATPIADKAPAQPATTPASPAQTKPAVPGNLKNDINNILAGTGLDNLGI